MTFRTIEGAGHFIWFGRYGGKVSAIQSEYLDALGFDWKYINLTCQMNLGNDPSVPFDAAILLKNIFSTKHEQ